MFAIQPTSYHLLSSHSTHLAQLQIPNPYPQQKPEAIQSLLRDCPETSFPPLYGKYSVESIPYTKVRVRGMKESEYFPNKTVCSWALGISPTKLSSCPPNRFAWKINLLTQSIYPLTISVKEREGSWTDLPMSYGHAGNWFSITACTATNHLLVRVSSLRTLWVTNPFVGAGSLEAVRR